MTSRNSITLTCLVLFLVLILPAKAEKIGWRQLFPHFWLAKGQQWGPVRFSAIRFHLGYYHLNLVDIRSYRDAHLHMIRDLSDNRKFSNELLDVGINVIFKTWTERSNIVAVAPAGWSTTLRKIEHAGFLKIKGVPLAEFDQRDSLSAILCLHSPYPGYRNLEYQAPVFFQMPEQRARGESCEDAVQVGPRIIEDPNVSQPRGIAQSESSLRPQLRVVFAVDNPERRFPAAKPNNKLKENARNGYIIVTEVPAHLFDIQEMLLSRDFYDEAWQPHWAVNMAGGGPSGLIVRDETDGTTLIGNPSGTIGSALVITREPNRTKVPVLR